MPLFNFRPGVVQFVHIPKTGGSSIVTALSEFGPCAMFLDRRSKYLPCTPQHLMVSGFDELIPEGFADYAFTIVRHPMSRLMSEYRYQSRRHSHKWWGLPGFDRWVARSLKATNFNKYHCDNHFRPQVEFLSDSVQVFKFEEDGLRRALNAVCDFCGVNRIAEVPHEMLAPAVDTAASFKTIEHVREFYADDFETFGYDPMAEIP